MHFLGVQNGRRIHKLTMSNYALRNRGVAFFKLNNGTNNVLNLSVRQELMEALSQSQRDRALGFVILSDRRVFSTGFDLPEVIRGIKHPNYHMLNHALESHSIPVVSYIAGKANGAGLELALASHYRVCSNHTKVSFSEVNLGLFPSDFLFFHPYQLLFYI